jgi:hypothetical protein
LVLEVFHQPHPYEQFVVADVDSRVFHRTG